MLQRFRADLHVHTCLSPCADLEMSPRKIVAEALRKGMRMVAICDHNSAENVAAVKKAAEGSSLEVIPGLEVCSKEEVHVLALFELLGGALEMQSLVYNHLAGQNDPEVFGVQVVANENDEVVSFQEKLLIGAVDLPIERIICEVRRLGGAVIASHIDRESYSVISQLGFIPEGLRFDALELTAHIDDAGARRRYHDYMSSMFIRNSDAHLLADIGKNTCEYLLGAPVFQELRKALSREDGRMVCGVN